MGERSFTAIKNTLFERLHEASDKKVAHNHKVSTHIGTGAAALTAFLNVLNQLPLFKADGLFLAPGKVSNTANVEELLTAILRNYSDRGWVVVFP